jgi:hypothetical protein
VTMIELAFFLLELLCAALGWRMATHLWGPYIGIIGAVIAFFVPFLLGRLVLAVNDIILDHWPMRPMCENNTCKWNDYTVDRIVGHEVEFICKCGKKYLKSGRQFYRIREDGQREPYKVRGKKHRWEDDNPR